MRLLKIIILIIFLNFSCSFVKTKRAEFNGFIGSIRYLFFEDYKGATENFSQAISLNPSDQDYYYLRGLCEYLSKDYENAINDFSKLIEFNQNNAEVYEFRGNAKLALKKFEESKADFEKAIELDPNNEDVKENLEFVKKLLENKKQ
ncbi:MAG: tetratricopeptide repeat protein [Leptospiraceae bacterium]|nr:tetratricopeptide repeat protein [Leptospiraceae bacterium]